MKNVRIMAVFMFMFFLVAACDDGPVGPYTGVSKNNFETTFEARQTDAYEVSDDPLTYRVEIFAQNFVRGQTLRASHLIVPEESASEGLQQFNGEFEISFGVEGTVFGFYDGCSVEPSVYGSEAGLDEFSY